MTIPSDPTPSPFGVLYDRAATLLAYCKALTAQNPFARYWSDAGVPALDVDSTGQDTALIVQSVQLRYGLPGRPAVHIIDPTSVLCGDLCVWAIRAVTVAGPDGSTPTDGQRTVDSQLPMWDRWILSQGILAGCVNRTIWPGQVTGQFVSATSLDPSGGVIGSKITLAVDLI